MYTWLAILVVVLVILVVIGYVLWSRSTRSTTTERSGPTDPFHTGDQDSLRGDPRELKAGDIVEIRGDAYTVRGSLRLSEGGWTWSEHLLDDSKGTQVWLGVEEDPDLSLSLWKPLDDADELRPGASKIEVEHRTYRSEESGTASFRSEATTGLDEHGTMQYHDYEGPGGSLLSFEAYGEAGWEASRGEELTRYDVRIYPTAD
ncbi:hypothetical protein FHX42_004011 [Saccharopolyspora lacisalsi]|uniref:DUF4178 domain-containing protein n=1 Tax=Halosaccharopolyspora lacisalsi TaxID=1000566 RepID=A0A839DXE0_9PSEU|nr:DUF4178 domain-containing protein [Halosaccharopolyspora lacisalsi]MBA8826632.1 hypothetical protein [Halosaccharopolyspora lacisalsi]